MRFQLTTVLLAASAALSLASPFEARDKGPGGGSNVSGSGKDNSGNGGKGDDDGGKGDNNPHPSPRPPVTCNPKHPGVPPPSPPARNRTCIIQSHNDGVTNDADFILQALHDCNDGGIAVFTEGTEYFVATAMDLTFLQHIDLNIQGRILFSNDTDYWQTHSFPFVFQNVTSFFKLGGEDVMIYGGGTLDGNGQVWYDLFAQNDLILRPVLIGIDGLHDSILTDLVLRFSPEYYHFVANSTNVIFNNINIAGASTSVNIAKNTDGWDVYRSSDITIQNSVINNGDDCVSFKPNSTNILVQNLFCNGSHGISVGSLGQFPGEFDIVENVYVFNTSLHNATDGARIKIWPDAPTVLEADLQGGGGSGRVTNITYDTMFIDNVDYAIEMDQCYGQSNLTLCLEFPSLLTVNDILFTNFQGVTSTKFTPEIAAFACSSSGVCGNIVAEGINVVTPKGTKQAYCLNVDNSTLDVTCSGVSLGFN